MRAAETIARLVAAIGLQRTYICLTLACLPRAYGDSWIMQLHVIQERIWKIQ